jgi:tetratricopeptide (TPR) repeat protein
MSKYHRKQRKQGPDEFIDFWSKAYKVAEPYMRAIGITVGAAVVVWFAGYGFTAYREHKAQNAAEQMGRAVKIYEADLLGENETPPKPEAKGDDEEVVPRFKTEKERADATFAALDELERKWSGSDVARDSLVFRAGALYDQQRYDDAIAAYRKFLGALKGQDLALGQMAREGLGLSLEAQGKLDEALTAYQDLEPHEGARTGDFYRDRAWYDQARVQRKKGDKQKAAALYNQLLSKMPQSLLRDEAQSQLALLESP